MEDRLNADCTLAEYQLTHVALVSTRSTAPSSRSVSTSDIIRLQQREAEILAREAVIAKRNLVSRSSAVASPPVGSTPTNRRSLRHHPVTGVRHKSVRVHLRKRT